MKVCLILYFPNERDHNKTVTFASLILSQLLTEYLLKAINIM